MNLGDESCRKGTSLRSGKPTSVQYRCLRVPNRTRIDPLRGPRISSGNQSDGPGDNGSEVVDEKSGDQRRTNGVCPNKVVVDPLKSGGSNTDGRRGWYPDGSDARKDQETVGKRVRENEEGQRWDGKSRVTGTPEVLGGQGRKGRSTGLNG